MEKGRAREGTNGQRDCSRVDVSKAGLKADFI
jgi:hypothetical protein